MKIMQSKQDRLNVDETNNSDSNYELLNREDIENTPFTVITTEEEGSFIVMGKYRLSEPFTSKFEAIQEAEKITWNRIIQVMMILLEQMETIKDVIKEGGEDNV